MKAASAGYVVCGAADLLAAVFWESPDLVRLGLGLPMRKPPHVWQCRSCGQQTMDRADLTLKTCLCATCAAPVPIACCVCEKVVLRRRCDVLQSAERGAKDQFCGRQYQGVKLGKEHGFTAHPGNGRLGTLARRKYDWDMVWQKHLETGFGATRLSRLLGIPAPAVDKILYWTRRRLVNAKQGGTTCKAPS